MSITPISAQTYSTLTPVSTGATPAASNSSSSSSSGVTFGDVLDAINPLQHIPIISSAYRSITGDTISSGAQIAGDTMYGALLGGGTLIAGAISAAAASANAGIAATTGNDATGHVLATLGITSTPSASLTPTTALTATASKASPSLVPTPSTSSINQPTTYSWQHPEKIAAHYQRAATLDSAHQYLAAMGTNHAVRKFKDTTF